MNGESGISFKELFNKDIDRNINGVIKANDEKNLNDEVNEYVLTEEICRNLPNSLTHTTTRRTANRMAHGFPVSSVPVNRTC